MMRHSLIGPTNDQPIDGLLSWIETTFFESSATALCVVGVGIIGFRMLSGRTYLASATKTILAVALVFGAPALAATFIGLANQQARLPSPELEADDKDLREPLPVNDDPNSGASLRRD